MLKQDAHTKTHVRAAQAGPQFPRAEKQPKTPEELAEIAYLDKLRLHRKRYGW